MWSQGCKEEKRSGRQAVEWEPEQADPLGNENPGEPGRTETFVRKLVRENRVKARLCQGWEKTLENHKAHESHALGSV
jgi:hypothetical protein